MRALLVALPSVGAALALSGCPHPPPEPVGPTAAEALNDVEVWIFGAGDELAKVERGSVEPVHFDPGYALPRGEVKVANTEGWALGFDTYVDSSFTFESISDLRNTETASFTCYVFNWYLAHPEIIPAPEEFEELMLEELVHRVLPPAPREQFAGAVETFRKGIVEAQNAPEAVANTAVTTFCSLPKS